MSRSRLLPWRRPLLESRLQPVFRSLKAVLQRTALAVVIVAASVRADGQRQLSVVSRQTILEKDDDGKAIPGFALDDCSEIYGDRLDGPVMWKANTNGSALSGRLVRLRFVMSDADLYAFRFVDCRE